MESTAATAGSVPEAPTAPEVPTAAPKRPMTPEQLEKLKLARERAVEVRKQKAAEKQRAKELKEREFQALKAQNDAREAALGSLPAPAPAPAPVPAPKPKKVRKVVVEQESSDSEVEYVVVKRGKKKASEAPAVPATMVNPYAVASQDTPWARAEQELRRDVGFWAASNMRTKIDDIKKEMLLKQLGGGF